MNSAVSWPTNSRTPDGGITWRGGIRGLTMGAHLYLGGPDECSVELQDRAGVSRVSCDTWSEVSIPEFQLAASKYPH